MPTRKLYTYPLNPFCRKVELMLLELKLPYEPVSMAPWETDKKFLQMNPAGELPVLVEENKHIFAHHMAICEYLNALHPSDLLGKTAEEGAEIRRLIGWIDGKFYQESVAFLLNELLYKRVKLHQSPNMSIERPAVRNLEIHLEYFNYLVDLQNYLTGTQLSLADLALAAHLSVLDYLGVVPWKKYNDLKSWYSTLKSRNSISKILKQRIVEFLPDADYNTIDF